MTSTNFSLPAFGRANVGRSMPTKNKVTSGYTPSLTHATSTGDSFSPMFAGGSPKAGQASKTGASSSTSASKNAVKVASLPSHMEEDSEFTQTIAEKTFTSPYELALHVAKHAPVIDMRGSWKRQEELKKLEENPDNDKIAKEFLSKNGISHGKADSTQYTPSQPVPNYPDRPCTPPNSWSMAFPGFFRQHDGSYTAG